MYDMHLKYLISAVLMSSMCFPLWTLVLWYVFPGGKIIFLVQFFDIGSHGDLSFQKIH